MNLSAEQEDILHIQGVRLVRLPGGSSFLIQYSAGPF